MLQFLKLNKSQHIELIEDFINISKNLKISNSLQKIKENLNFYYDPRMLLLVIQIAINKKSNFSKY